MDAILNNNGVSLAMRLFHYIPALIPAAVALAVYAVVAIYLTIPLMEVIGFAVRILCHFYTDLGRYIGMTMFLLLAPNALALVNYKAVGEIIRLSNVETNRFYLRPKFVTWFFFSSDIFSFCLQGAGGGLQSTVDHNQVGIAVTLVGLALQLFFFACFAGITLYVQRNPNYQYYVEGQPNAKNRLILCLYVTIGLIYIRSIYRVAEYATGYGGPIAKLEWAFYVFDTIVIFLSFIVYCVFFIGNYLPKHNAASQLPTDNSSSSSQTEKGDVETASKL
ncbi:hypothetical protein MBANPS3_007123 [Mucor bainieri]